MCTPEKFKNSQTASLKISEHQLCEAQKCTFQIFEDNVYYTFFAKPFSLSDDHEGMFSREIVCKTV